MCERAWTRYERSCYPQNKEFWFSHWILPLSSIFKLFWNQERQEKGIGYCGSGKYLHIKKVTVTVIILCLGSVVISWLVVSSVTPLLIGWKISVNRLVYIVLVCLWFDYNNWQISGQLCYNDFSQHRRSQIFLNQVSSCPGGWEKWNRINRSKLKKK